MRLKDAAGFFDRTVCRDVYSSYSFKAQLEPLDYFKLDGASVLRRLLSTVPGVNIPARRAARIGTQVFLFGDSSPDQWAGEDLRIRYVLQAATNQATVQTIPQALANSGGFTAYASRDWSKDLTDSRVSAENISQYQIIFAKDEAVEDEAIITLDDGKVYFVQGVHRALSGFLAAAVNEVPTPVYETVPFGDRVYDPVTDSYTTTTTNVRVLRLRWQEAFQYLTRASVEYERGDLLVMMLKAGTPTPTPNDTLTLSDGLWRIVSHLDRGTYYSLHLRRQ